MSVKTCVVFRGLVLDDVNGVRGEIRLGIAPCARDISVVFIVRAGRSRNLL